MDEEPITRADIVKFLVEYSIYDVENAQMKAGILLQNPQSLILFIGPMIPYAMTVPEAIRLERAGASISLLATDYGDS